MTDAHPELYDVTRYRLPGRDRVAIVGFAESTRHLAPLTDERYEIWGLNNGYVHLKRADRWFELHSEDLYGWDLRRPGDHVGWLKKFAGPVYMIEARPEIPTSVRYPIEQVVASVGAYLTSGPAYMLALAILEGFERIEVYGIDLATNTEYADQRPGFEFLLGLAMGRGIEVALPRGCALLQGPLYGRGDLNPGGEHHTRTAFEGRLKALAKRRQEQDEIILQAQLMKARLEGATLECQYWIGQTPQGGDPRRLLEQMDGPGKALVEAKGRGGLGAVGSYQHPTGDLADG